MKLKVRRGIVVLIGLLGAIIWVLVNPESYETIFTAAEDWGETSDELGVGRVNDLGDEVDENVLRAVDLLEKLEVKGRAPKIGYRREEFYDGWPMVDGCSLRQKILKREFGDSAVLDGCNVVAGEYDEPYTGEHRVLANKSEVGKIQIDHVVALSDAWQKGAQYMTSEERFAIATDPLNLLAVDGKANEQKSDGDAATWLPKNKGFRCQYVARQISVKYKYALWLAAAEKEAMTKILANCPNEPAVGV